jgi:hypothetical protein
MAVCEDCKENTNQKCKNCFKYYCQEHLTETFGKTLDIKTEKYKEDPKKPIILCDHCQRKKLKEINEGNSRLGEKNKNLKINLCYKIIFFLLCFLILGCFLGIMYFLFFIFL